LLNEPSSACPFCRKKSIALLTACSAVRKVAKLAALASWARATAGAAQANKASHAIRDAEVERRGQDEINLGSMLEILKHCDLK
jgi:hypothetical protein